MRRKMRVSLLALLVMASTYLVLPLVPANATGLPPTQYPPLALTNTPSPSYALSQPDGGVTVGCSGGSIATKRIDAAGAIVHDIPSSPSYPNTCARNAAVGADGTLFTVAANSANGFTTVQAIKNGVVRWTYEFGCMVSVRGMVVGTNGNLYVLATGQWPCSGMNKLVGIASEPMNGAPNVVLNIGMAAVLVDGGLASYQGGLVLRTTGGIQYVGYDGLFGTGVAVTNMIGLGSAEYADATLAGRVVVASRANCLNPMAGKLTSIDPAGTMWDYNLTTCSSVEAVRPTPSGGVVAHIVTQGVPYLLMVDANGQETAVVSVASVPPGAQLVSQAFKVDLHGNVALQRWLTYDGQHKAIQLKTYSGISGIELGTYELGWDTVSGYGHHTYADLAIGRNTWYVPAFQCWYGSCQPTGTKLYAVTVPGLGMDYPRGAIISPPVPVRNYVALGDSFSSGEGVPGFDPATDTAGPPENRCHRSVNGAYPKMLAATPSLNLNLTGFVACSGASINAITEGSFDENPQLSALDGNTRIITLSVGGNDVPFREFVTACLFADCSVPAVKDGFFANLSGITSQLQNLYAGPNGIHAEAPNAKIYAVGYPQLLPESGCGQTDTWMNVFNANAMKAREGNPFALAAVFFIGQGAGLTTAQIETFIDSGVAEFNTAEIATARTLVVQLNQAIKAAVEQINQPWLVYVDPLAASSPFVGHELCTAQPYFSGVTINPFNLEHDTAYSYHPNEHGQEAYKQLILQQL